MSENYYMYGYQEPDQDLIDEVGELEVKIEDLELEISRLEDELSNAIQISWIEKWLDKITNTRDGEDIDISQLSEQLQFAIEMINSMVMDWDIENGHFRWGKENKEDGKDNFEEKISTHS